MSVSVRVASFRSDHWNEQEERESVELDTRLAHERRGSMLVAHLSRTACDAVAVDRNAGPGSALRLQCGPVPADTHLVLRMYDWVHNYDLHTQREHVWCLNAVWQHAFALESARRDIQGEHFTMVLDIQCAVQQCDAPYTAAALERLFKQYTRQQQEFYYSAHPPLVPALDCMNVFQFLSVNRNVAGLTFPRSTGPISVPLLEKLYDYALERYRYLYGERIDMARFCHLLLPLLSLGMPYKPDIVYRGARRVDVDYFDDPTLSEAGDCEDLSLLTLRIAEMLCRAPAAGRLAPVVAFLRGFVWGLALVSINIESAHMMVLGVPRREGRAMLVESTAPTLWDDLPTQSHGMVKFYARRHVYNFVITMLVNDYPAEYTFLTGKFHGADIETMLREPTSMERAVAVPCAREDIEALAHHGRDQLPYMLPQECPTASTAVHQQGRIDPDRPVRMGLCNVHTFLHLKKHQWPGMGANIKVLAQALTPTLDAYVVLLQ